MKTQEIKFGTDGWRAIIADDYTLENLIRVTTGTGKWMQEKGFTTAVIGHDCRFGGALFAKTTAVVLAEMGIQVQIAPDFVSTPMVSLATVKTGSDMGIVITASHNPPSYNGFKLKSAYGGPTIPRDIKAVEELIPDEVSAPKGSFEEYLESGLITMLDMEQMYIDHIREHFDMPLLEQYGKHLAYDAMYGAGQNVIKRLFPDATLLHCDSNPSFMGQAPEPIDRNLQELSETIAGDASLLLGLANDGDADRIGMYDEDGKFVDSHHLLLLLLYYMREFKKEDGKVVVTFSVTDKMQNLANQYGLDFEVTKIGFKYIAEIMTQEDVLVGGEESGGLAVKGHIPERDGIWNGLLIMEFMAKTGKSIKELVHEIYAKVGTFSFDRDDLHIDNDKKWAIMDKCAEGEIISIGGRKVVRTENIDGYKFFLDDGSWLMVRPSGTEPVLRVYAQSHNAAEVRSLLDDAHKELGN